MNGEETLPDTGKSSHRAYLLIILYLYYPINNLVYRVTLHRTTTYIHPITTVAQQHRISLSDTLRIVFDTSK